MKAKRIIDANANRAREAIRVMEDAARFVLDDAPLTDRLKHLRHDLAAALGPLGPLTGHRDTEADVGTAISTPAERSRASVADVVIAAGKRTTEALRAIEEYAKTLDPTVAQKIEAIRYTAYTIEADLVARFARPDPATWRVCVLITESLCTHHDWFDVARLSLEGGADCLQLREKDLEGSELLDRTKRLVELAHTVKLKKGRARPAVILNDRPDIALLAEADGVHLGQHDLPIAEARRLVGCDKLIGISTHNLAEAGRAVKGGADYCGVGAMFPTTTKPRKPAGPAYLKKFVNRYPDTPHLAIGGITAANLTELIQAGGRAVAVSSLICGATSPKAAVTKLRRSLG